MSTQKIIALFNHIYHSRRAANRWGGWKLLPCVAPQRRVLRSCRERARKRRDLAAFPQTAMSHQRRRAAFELSMKTHEQFGP